MRIVQRSLLLVVIAGLLGIAGAPVLAKSGHGAKAAAPMKPPGPAKKMKIIAIHVMETVTILKLQFQDAKGNATKAPDGGQIWFKCTVTKPKTKTVPMSEVKWKPATKTYVVSQLPPRKRIVCPPRGFRVWARFKIGKRTKFSATKYQKFPCLK